MSLFSELGIREVGKAKKKSFFEEMGIRETKPSAKPKGQASFQKRYVEPTRQATLQTYSRVTTKARDLEAHESKLQSIGSSVKLSRGRMSRPSVFGRKI